MESTIKNNKSNFIFNQFYYAVHLDKSPRYWIFQALPIENIQKSRKKKGNM